MFTLRFIALATLAAALANAVDPVTLVSKAQPKSDPGALDLSGTDTDTTTIVDTATVIDQKSGPSDDDGPDGHEPPPTSVTALDGDITNQPINSTRRAVSPFTRRIPGRFARRTSSNYEQVFAGKGPNNHDGSIQGTAYLTFKTVNNATYNVDECLAFCTSVPECVFANLFYEFNNPGLDAGDSNLKCALYGDIHTAAEKTNLGGQQQAPPPAGLTYITESSGWAAKFIEDPDTPEGYEKVFGPLDGANNAPGYMGFAFLDRYDVNACAQLCNTRGADGNGGACQFFNIWRALVNGNPTTYTCSMYYVVADASSAVNYGQGDLKVTYSRGYRRTSVVPDGGFESYVCADPTDICWTEQTTNWIGTSPAGGHWDALIFSYTPYAHAGHSVGALGSGDGVDTLAGTLTPAKPLQTKAGSKYSLNFFHSSSFNGALQTNAFVDIKWNGAVIATIRPGNSPWTFYQYEVTAQGNDKLEFHGGSFPAYDFIDDVYLFLL